jgi:hypothetical protein
MKAMRHHPDYDPVTECGCVTLTKCHAELLMVAVGAAFRAYPNMTDVEKVKLLAAASAIDDVFGLGVRTPKKTKAKLRADAKLLNSVVRPAKRKAKK